MAVLVIDGYTFEVQQGAQRQAVQTGQPVQMFSGRWRDTRRASGQRWSFVTTEATDAEGQVIEALIARPGTVEAYGDALGRDSDGPIDVLVEPGQTQYQNDADSFTRTVSFEVVEAHPLDTVLRYAPGFGNLTHSRADASAIATYQDNNGDWQLVSSATDLRDAHYIDGVRHTLLELSRANKCQYNYNYGTNGTTGWSTSGDAAGVLSVEDHTTLLAEAGLGELVSDGRVLKLDNSGGTTAFHANASGTTGNTNPHSISAWLRGSGSVSFAGADGVSSTSGTAYERVRSENVTPASTTITLRVTAQAGQTVYVILPQMEEGAFATTPILTQASTVTRAADIAYIDLPTPIDTPTAWAAYLRFKDIGTRSISGGRVFEVGTGTAPRVVMLQTGSGYRMLHANATSSVTSTLSALPALNDDVEVVGILNPDGSVQALQSLNAGTATSSTASDELKPASAWNNTRLYLNSVASGSVGAMALRDVKISYRGGRIPLQGTGDTVLRSVRHL